MAQVIIGIDGLCTCHCTDKCVCKKENTGMGFRCSEQEILEAGHTPLKLFSEKDEKALSEYNTIDGKEKRLKIQCVELKKDE